MSVTCEEQPEVCESEPALAEPDARDAQLGRNLLFSTADGTLYSVMVGTGEQYLPAFVLALGMGEVASGLIATVPLLIGALVQLLSPLGLRRTRSHRRWVYRLSYVQAAIFLPLALAALSGGLSLPMVFGLAACYWAMNFAVGPPWYVWMEQLVPREIRARFFARRTRFSQAGLLTGFVVAGLILQSSDAIGRPIWVFAILFGVAGLSRAISASCLVGQSEPESLRGDVPVLSLRQVFRNALTGRAGRLLTYLWLVQGAAQISGPFFTAYMLEQLHFSYGIYVMLLGASFAAKIASAPLWGRVAHRYGPRALLAIGGVAIIPMSALWLFGKHPAYLFLVQILAGTSWAAYELAFLLMFFDSFQPRERNGILTVYNLGFATATVAGSLLGSGCLWLMGPNPAAFLTIFGLSSLLRLGTLPWLFRVPTLVAPRPTTTTVVYPTESGIESGPTERAA